MTELRATARLQLHAGFTLRDAAAQVPYYARLGVSHLYLSPIGTAVPGSTHGYDVTDPGQVNPELGGEAALAELHAAVQAHEMGLILDIVPNHMAADPHNPWWWDVLRHGRGSRFADWFDIDWRSPGHDGKLWLPVLDRPYAQALAEGVLKLVLDATGEPQLEHHQTPFPVRVEGGNLPQDLQSRRDWAHRINQGALRGEDTLHRLLERQAYRLAWWRVGNDMINYRRFFDITSLAAIRVERADVFNAVHALPLRLIGQGVLDGLRLDHVDGLADPRGYLRRLRAQVDKAGRRRGLPPGKVVLLVEKILAPGEHLPRDWPVQGTTGYDFMDQVSGVLHDPNGQPALTRLWVAHSGRSGDFAQEEFQARGELLEGSLQAEFNRALHAAMATARLDLASREFSPQMLGAALAAVMRRFPVYRTYAGNDGLDAQDAALFQAAAQLAREHARPHVQAALDALQRWMHDQPDTPTIQRSLRRVLRRRMEQLSAPLNAKSVEDTAFYRHGVLLSRNEVGSHPVELALDPQAFHQGCQARAAGHQRAMLATATHDHKRGEDLRMRLAVLSAQPAWWAQQVEAFSTMAGQLGLAPGHVGPDAGDALMLWQMLVGAWPLALEPDDAQGLAEFAERMAGWQSKAVREAKLRSTWTEPDERYEAAARALLDAALVQDAGKALRHALHADRTGARAAGCDQRPGPGHLAPDHPGCARPVPGHRRLGPVAGRSGQPPPRGFRPAPAVAGRSGALAGAVATMAQRPVQGAAGGPAAAAAGKRARAVRARRLQAAARRGPRLRPGAGLSSPARRHRAGGGRATPAGWRRHRRAIAAGRLLAGRCAGPARWPLSPPARWARAGGPGQTHGAGRAVPPFPSGRAGHLAVNFAMDPTARTRRIEQLAHEIWEAEGRPDGQSARHWAMAERLVDAELRAAAQSEGSGTPPFPHQEQDPS